MEVILEGQKKRGRQKETKKHRNRVKETKIYGIVYIIYTQDYIEKDKARLSKKRENRIFGRVNLLNLASLVSLSTECTPGLKTGTILPSHNILSPARPLIYTTAL